LSENSGKIGEKGVAEACQQSTRTPLQCSHSHTSEFGGLKNSLKKASTLLKSEKGWWLEIHITDYACGMVVEKLEKWKRSKFNGDRKKVSVV
jgi:hypothetical protein